MGLLQVGPQSAGADPGPACYGQGGTEPTTSRRQSRARLSQSRRAARRQAAARPGEGARRDQDAHRRSARHLGRAGRLRHVHHRQQQHGERHPPRLGRARLRSARFRAGRRRRRHGRAHHGARARDGHRHGRSCRSSPRACAPSARSSPTSSTTTWRPAPLRLDNERPTSGSTRCSRRSKRKASRI